MSADQQSAGDGRRRGRWRLAWVCLLLAALFPWTWGPWLGTVALRAALRRNLPGAAARVGYLSLTRARVERVYLGFATCRSIDLHFSPLGLWRRELAAVHVEGAQACLEVSSNRVVVVGLPHDRGRRTTPHPPAEAPLHGWRVRKLSLAGATLSWSTPTRARRPLVELHGDVSQRGDGHGYTCYFHSPVLGAPVEVFSIVTPQTRSGYVRIVFDDLQVSRLQPLLDAWQPGASRIPPEIVCAPLVELHLWDGRITKIEVDSTIPAWRPLLGELSLEFEQSGSNYIAGSVSTRGGCAAWPGLGAVSNLAAGVSLLKSDWKTAGRVKIEPWVFWERLEAGGVAWRAGDMQSRVGDGGRLITGSLPLQAEGSAVALEAAARVTGRGRGGELSLTLPPTRLVPEDGLLRRLGPDILVSGQVAATATVSWAAQGEPCWQAMAAVTDGEAKARDGAWRVGGIETRVSLEGGRGAVRWPVVTSTFGSAEAGGLALDGGRVRWQRVEGEWLVERADLAWCGGWAHVHGVRLNPRDPDVDGVLYLEQIDAARLIKLVKPLDGEATGRLHGRLPLRLRHGRLALSGGYLYSLPGEGGRLKLRDTTFVEQYLAGTGLPKAQRAQVAAAVRDLDYDYLRLDLAVASRREARLTLRVAGRSARDHELPPVNLDIRVNGPLEALLNFGLQVNRAGRERVETDDGKRGAAGAPGERP